MGGFNRVILMGNLTRDPEQTFTNGGMAIVKFGLAVNERVKKGDEWVDQATFVDVTMFGKRGEAFAKYHAKGAQAFIEGKLRLDQWEDKQSGGKRSKLYVVADSFEFVGGKQESGGGSEPRAQAASGGGGDDWTYDTTPF